MPSLKNIAAISFALFILVSAGAIWHRHRTPPPIPAYTVEKPLRRDLVQIISASGTIKARDQILVGSLAAGKVEKVIADENMIVKKGDVLAVLDNGIGDCAVRQASAQLEQARINFVYQDKYYRRQQALFAAGQMAENLFDQATQQYNLARARVDELDATVDLERKRFDCLQIKAPDDGVIVACKIELGQMITSQFDAKVLYEIAKDLTDIEVQVDVDEADIGAVKKGQSASFSVDAHPSKRFKSSVHEVQFLAKVVDNSVTYSAILHIKNPDLLLRPGMTANVDIKTAQQKNTLCVPASALRINSLKLAEYAQRQGITCTRLPNGKASKRQESLWIIEHSAKLTQVPVTFGIRDGNFVEVTGGLGDEQLVVTSFNQVEESSFLNSFFNKSSGSIGGK